MSIQKCEKKKQKQNLKGLWVQKLSLPILHALRMETGKVMALYHRAWGRNLSQHSQEGSQFNPRTDHIYVIGNVFIATTTSRD